MKFIRCSLCDELVRLRRSWQVCRCGKSRGRYLNGKKAVAEGSSKLYGVSSMDYFSGNEDWKEKLRPIDCQD